MSENKLQKPITVCYFGIYRPTAPRDKVYFDGLKKMGVSIVECVDNSSGLSKFFRLAEKHRALKGKYDIMWVGYLSALVVPLAWFLSSKKIVFNALSSWHEAAVLDRAMYKEYSWQAILIWLFDFFAFHMVDVSLVESENQKKYISKTFWVSGNKLEVVWTGADENVFYPDASVPKAPDFTVIFRGMFLPATGVDVVIETANILKGNRDIHFRIIGWGQPIQNQIQKKILDYGLSNVNLTTVFLDVDELRRTMLSAHIMLGQFGDHERLNRTIQNKNFEAIALGQAFITRDSISNRELLTDGENCIFVPPNDSVALSEAILSLKNDSVLCNKIASGARELYIKKCSSEVLAVKVKNFLLHLINE